MSTFSFPPRNNTTTPTIRTHATPPTLSMSPCGCGLITTKQQQTSVLWLFFQFFLISSPLPPCCSHQPLLLIFEVKQYSLEYLLVRVAHPETFDVLLFLDQKMSNIHEEVSFSNLPFVRRLPISAVLKNSQTVLLSCALQIVVLDSQTILLVGKEAVVF